MDTGDGGDTLTNAIEKRVNAKRACKEAQSKEKAQKNMFRRQQKPGANTQKEWSKWKTRWKEIRRELSAELSAEPSANLTSEAGWEIKGEACEKVPSSH